MKYLLMFILLSFSIYGRCQDTFKFNVIKYVSRIKKDNGKWDEWKEFKWNTRKQKIVFNLEGKWLQWITQEGAETPILHIYKIIELQEDSSYADFGMHEIEIKARQGELDPQLFKILFIESTTSTSYIMITGSEYVQSKYALKYEE